MRRPSPALAVSVFALVVASTGTAVAAGELVTRPEQIAADIVDARHIRDGTVTRGELERRYLRVRVDAAGRTIGTNNDGTAERLEAGRYRVTFRNPAATNRADATIDINRCAIAATSTGTIRAPSLNVSRASSDPPGVVTVTSVRLGTNAQGEFDAVRESGPFDLVAVC